MTQKYIDLTNHRFQKLLVLVPANRPIGISSRDKYWKCLCDCGNTTIVSAKNLRHGTTYSCGCLQRERASESAKIKSVKHGYSRVGQVSREYQIWSRMIYRCVNQNNQSYKYYGGRGIKVCAQWRNSFRAFLEDVGPAPSSKYSLDRINNNGNYEPGNVRWATDQEQSRNRRDRKPITFDGKTQYLVDWAKETGIKLATIHDRIYKHGWSVEKALTTDPKIYHKRSS